MKRILTLFTFLLSLSFAHAQLTAEDIVFWVGSGDQEAYFLIDFRDGTPDASFAWGIRFEDSDNLTMTDALEMIAQADAGLSYRATSGFLNDVIYNHHEGIDSQPDWWSTWSGDTFALMGMQGGVSESLTHTRWYGLSYGFMPMPVKPAFDYAAYNAEWFSLNEVDYWVEEGANKLAVSIDFVEADGEDIVTYVWGLNYDGDINGLEALEALALADDDLEVDILNGELVSIQYKNLFAELDADNAWKSFAGNTLSDYRPWDLDADLFDFDMFGLSFGKESVRRPYIPTPVEDPKLSVDDFTIASLKIWPNPTTDVLFVETEENLNQVRIINTAGALVKHSNSKRIDVSDLKSGVYLIEIESLGQRNVLKFIKK